MTNDQLPITNEQTINSPHPLNATRLILILLAIVLLAGAGLGMIFARRLLVDLPHPDSLYRYAAAPSTKIFDRHGTLLYEITGPHQGLHTPLPLADIPQSCIDATIATEDASFYRNPGVDVWAIARALVINLRGGQVLSGGSTITQQLARNLLLSPQERHQITLTRKLREAILAWRLARTYAKDEILTLYLNETYYGNLAYGLEAASRTYFGKHAAELDVAECALLAGLPQSPANYNPLENPQAARARQQVVLNLMEKQGVISADEAAAARTEKLGFAAVPFPIRAPHFVMAVRAELEREFGLEAMYTQGLQVTTTLDLDAQNTARQVMQRRLAELTETRDGEPPREVRNAAVVALNPHSGDVLAMVGSPNYFDPRIDGAVNAALTARQPGSSIKPITYAAAFDPQIAAAHGYAPLTPGTMMVDVRTAFVTKEGRPYVPQNYDRRWHGPVLLRQSLASSFNLIAVKVLDTVGLEAMTDLARSLGISTFDNRQFGLALTLGGGEVRLLELTAAYAAFANGGQRIEPVLISRVADSAGRVLYRRPANLNPGPRVLDARTAYLITDILSDDYARRSGFGAGSVLQLDRPAAAKTGTTTDWRDNWTVGYTPNLVVGVWAGNADNEPMRHVSGVTGAAPIWHDVLALLLKGRPAQPFPRPVGLVEREICTDNGLLPVDKNQDPGFRIQDSGIGGWQAEQVNSQLTIPNSQSVARCPHTLTEVFIAGTEPRQVDDWHIAVALDRRTGLRVGPGCKLDFVTLQTYTRYPAEAEAWARRQGIPQPPDIYSPLCPNPDAESSNRPPPHAAAPSPFSLIFTSPDQGSVYRISPKIPRDKQKIRVAVRPADGVQVAQVELRVNGAPLAAGPQTLWQMSPGEFTFEAVGFDPAGNPLPARPVTVQVVE